MHEAAEQMANRDGPYYKRWLLSKQKATDNYKASQEKAAKKYQEALEQEYHLATPVGQAETLMRIGNIHRALGEE